VGIIIEWFLFFYDQLATSNQPTQCVSQLQTFFIHKLSGFGPSCGEEKTNVGQLCDTTKNMGTYMGMSMGYKYYKISSFLILDIFFYSFPKFSIKIIRKIKTYVSFPTIPADGVFPTPIDPLTSLYKPLIT